MSGIPWEVLGIARTEDDGDIRRAYSRKLKAIDVDQDPAAFILLRDALQAARTHAAHARARHMHSAGADGGQEAEREAEAAPPAPENEPVVVPIRPAWIDDVEAIQALIYGEHPREEIFAEVRERAERILSGPEMGEIDHAAQVEQWAVHVILSGVPRSNGLLGPAIERFDWLRRYQQWDCHPAIRAVVDRYVDCRFLIDLREGKGDFARPFSLIDRGAKPLSYHADSVEAFLNMARREHASLLTELPPESLQAWEALIERRSKRLVARMARARDAFWIKFGRFARRYYLNYLGIGLLWLVGILFVLGIAAASHGAALIFIAFALFRGRK